MVFRRMVERCKKKKEKKRKQDQRAYFFVVGGYSRTTIKLLDSSKLLGLLLFPNSDLLSKSVREPDLRVFLLGTGRKKEQYAARQRKKEYTWLLIGQMALLICPNLLLVTVLGGIARVVGPVMGIVLSLPNEQVHARSLQFG